MDFRIARTALALLGLVAGSTLASSHREAPLISEDPGADNTDVYAFVDPKEPDKVVLISNFIPLEEPAGGPNFHKFADSVLYDINIDNDGDGRAEIVYQFAFRTQVQNPDTFLYNTGPITSLDDPDFNIRQTYKVIRRDIGVPTVLGTNLATPPVNIGPRSTPNYETLAAAAVHTLPDGSKVFAGQRDEAFPVDLGSVFDLLGLRPFNGAHLIPLATSAGADGTSGYNVHTIALQIPISRLVRSDPVIGVWSSARRPKVTVLQSGGRKPEVSGPFVQVSRLGMPLVNEVVIPLRLKDRWNSSQPKDDAQFAPYVLDPEPAALIPVLFPNVFTCAPSLPRNDLVAIFGTGIPGLNQPQNVTGAAEMIRLNTSIAPTPLGQRDRLGLLATPPQLDGFPNGRRLEDDVVDIELRALAGATPLGDCDGVSPNKDLSDGVDGNDLPFLTEFPYMPTPHQGYDHEHGHADIPS
jgi:hypothetical protein